MTITVSNLPPQVTEADLTELFAGYGSIQKLEIFPDKNTASISLAGDQEEEAATREISGQEWRGKTLILELVYDSGSRGPDDPP